MVKQSWKEKLLILVKTYPQPSAQHRETTCVAAINQDGLLRRIFPVPYRFLDGEQQFKKWEWIEATISKANKDHRPESHVIDVDSIQRTGETIGTQHGWVERLRWIEPHVVESFQDLETRRQTSGHTLGVIRPSYLTDVDVTRLDNRDWTPEEQEKLRREGLFDNQNVRIRNQLRKIPYDFHYRYECRTADTSSQHRHKITDWEAGALFWNCYDKHNEYWEQPFRNKLLTDFRQKDMHFLMGTVHRFPATWLIIGLIYPQRQSHRQQALDL